MKANHITSLAITICLICHPARGGNPTEDQIKALEAKLEQLRAQADMPRTPATAIAVRGLPADVSALIEFMHKRFVMKHEETSIFLGKNSFMQVTGDFQAKCEKVRGWFTSEAARLNGEAEEVWKFWWEGATAMREMGIDNKTGLLDRNWAAWSDFHNDTRWATGTISRKNGQLSVAWNPDGYSIKLVPLDQAGVPKLLAEALKAANRNPPPLLIHP